MSDAEIADIREIQRRRVSPIRRMVAIDQHAARLADRSRPKTCAGPVRSAEIIRNARDANGGVGVAALDAEKARAHRKSRKVSHNCDLGKSCQKSIHRKSSE